MNVVIERTSAQVTHDAWLDQYYLLHLLKKGGMASIYLAYDSYTHRQVAIKLIERGGFNEKVFAREVRAMRRLDHPHILPLLQARRSKQWNYIVMPYIDGGTLQDRIDEQTLTFEEVSLILEQLADALEYMHAQGMVHCDIKPSNILLDGNDVYLADFGIAVQQEEEAMSCDEPIMGTLTYMAPEIYEGEISRRSDIYSLGIVLYQMLTGSVPFDDENVSSIYWKHKMERPLPPSLLNSSLSRPLERVIMQALEKEPQKRFQTAAAFAVAYQKAIAPSLLEQWATSITSAFCQRVSSRAFV